jgi:hypothetical protein
MGSVVSGIGDVTGALGSAFSGGGGNVQMGAGAANPTLGNATSLNLDFGKQIAANQKSNPNASLQPYQQNLISQLQAQANGQGPNLGQAQMQQATNQNIASQMALAASGRGANAGSSERAAMTNIANSQQDAAGQAANLGMQTQLASQSTLGNVLNQGMNTNLQNQGLQNNFAMGMTQLGSARDTGLMDAQLRGALGSAANSQANANMNHTGFGQLLSAGSGLAGILGLGGGGNSNPNTGFTGSGDMNNYAGSQNNGGYSFGSTVANAGMGMLF